MPSLEHDKKTGKTFCKPSTKDILLSLAEIPEWCKLLYQHTDAAYKEFLRALIDRNFYLDEKQIVLGKIAKEFKIDNVRLNKILTQIYEAVFEFNREQPKLFQQPGIPHELYLKYFDSHCEFNMWLPATPRLHEEVIFNFVNAKIGTTYFTVTKIVHELRDTGAVITLYLEGGTVNPYRQWLIDRALFEGEIGLLDTWNLPKYKLDEELKKIYK